MSNHNVEIEQAWTCALGIEYDRKWKLGLGSVEALENYQRALTLDHVKQCPFSDRGLSIQTAQKIGPDRYLRIQLAWTMYQALIAVFDPLQADRNPDVYRWRCEDAATSAIMHADLLISVHDRVQGSKK